MSLRFRASSFVFRVGFLVDLRVLEPPLNHVHEMSLEPCGSFEGVFRA